jgi:hypothetical protein
MLIKDDICILIDIIIVDFESRFIFLILWNSKIYHL